MNHWGYLDTLDVWDEAAAMPEQLVRALEAAQSSVRAAAFAAPRTLRAVTAFADGTGAVSCAAAAAMTAARLAVPFAVIRDGAVPAYVDEHTLVFAVSVNGEDEAVLRGAAESVARGARLLGIGGDETSSLARLVVPAERSGAAWCPLGPATTPRAQLGWATVSVLAVLAECGVTTDWTSSVTAAAAGLDRRRSAWLAPGAEPEALARRLGRTIPLVYGAEGIASLAARWWKAGVNRNAKAPAFASSVPSAADDELAGWGQGGDVTRQAMSLVLLRHAGEPPDAGGLFDRVRQATDEIMAGLYEVRAEGGDDLARFFDLSLFGELVSLHLAGREGVDPGPVPVLTDSGHSAAVNRT